MDIHSRITDHQALLSEAKAKETGKSVWDVMAEIAYGTDKRTAAAAMAMFKDATLVRETKQTKEVTIHAPVALPVMDGDPSVLNEGADAVPHPLN